jgi:hypothetical protein
MNSVLLLAIAIVHVFVKMHHPGAYNIVTVFGNHVSLYMHVASDNDQAFIISALACRGDDRYDLVPEQGCASFGMLVIAHHAQGSSDPQAHPGHPGRLGVWVVRNPPDWNP